MVSQVRTVGKLRRFFGEDEGTQDHLYKGYTREETLEIANELQVLNNRGRDLVKGYMGKVSPFYEADVFNEYDEKCTSGEPGEIVLRPRHPNVSLKEYFNKPAATKDSFRNLWFHTGDAGYKDVQGDFNVVDRMKDVNVVKEKIYPLTSLRILSISIVK